MKTVTITSAPECLSTAFHARIRLTRPPDRQFLVPAAGRGLLSPESHSP